LFLQCSLINVVVFHLRHIVDQQCSLISLSADLAPIEKFVMSALLARMQPVSLAGARRRGAACGASDDERVLIISLLEHGEFFYSYYKL
jgi:hypothetical protein